jgi:hypothetical protein
MQTVVEIDEDVLLAVEEIARKKKLSPSKVLSDLARQALKLSGPSVRNGVPLFPRQPDAQPVTLDIVNQLRDELT